MRTVGAFIAIVGVFILVTRSPGVIAPHAYRKFIINLFDNHAHLVRWLGRALLLYAAIFIVVTYVNFSQLAKLPVIIGACLQVGLAIGGVFFQYPAAAGEIAASLITEEPVTTRIVLLLATLLGVCLGAYGISLMRGT